MARRTKGPTFQLARKAFKPLAEGGDPLWNERRVFSRWEAWVYLLQRAAHTAYDYATRQEVVRIERGCTPPLAERYLMQAWGWKSRTKVRAFIVFCENDERLLPLKKTSDGVVYRVVNYEAWQLGSTTGETTADTTGHTTGHTTGGTKKKEVKEKKEGRVSAPSWSGTAIDVWVDVFGGITDRMAGRIGKALKPLVTAHTESVVLEYWAHYVRTEDGQYATPENFAERFDHWRKHYAAGGTRAINPDYLAAVIFSAGSLIWSPTTRDEALNALAARYGDDWARIGPYFLDIDWPTVTAAKADKFQLRAVLKDHIERHAHAA